MNFDEWCARLKSLGLHPAEGGGGLFDAPHGRLDPGKGFRPEKKVIAETHAALGLHLLEDIVEEYGSPLVVIDEKSALATVRAFLTMTSMLDATLKPQIKLFGSRCGQGAMAPSPYLSQTSQIYASISPHPTSELLRRLSSWGVGLIAQSVGEIDRALRAGVPAHTLLLSSSFKSSHDVLGAQKRGCLATEIESLDEVSELVQVTLGRESSQPALRVSLRLDFGIGHCCAGLSADEARFALDTLRRTQGIQVVGFSCAWAKTLDVGVSDYIAIVAKLREFTEEQLAAGFTVEFVMLGARVNFQFAQEITHKEFSEETDAVTNTVTSAATLSESCGQTAHAYSVATFEGFRGAPFKVFFSCADAIFSDSTHLIAMSVRTARTKGKRQCYLDVVLPTCIGIDVLPLSWVRGKREQAAHIGSFKVQSDEETFHVVCRTGIELQALEHGVLQVGCQAVPRYLLLPSVGLAFAAGFGALATLPRPSEVLVTESGEVFVLRARDTVEHLTRGET